MPKRSDQLVELYVHFVAKRSPEAQQSCRAMDVRNTRRLKRMAQQGIVTVGDLVAALPRLSRAHQELSFWLINIFKIRQAVPPLLKLLPKPSIRLSCAWVLSAFNADPKVLGAFLAIGERELRSPSPDRRWLEAVINGISFSDDRRATAILVEIFERTDLAGWLRGEAGNKLGCAAYLTDRRSRLYRRCRDAALRGLNEDDINVQFWSMYVIAELVPGSRPRRSQTLGGLETAFPHLRHIAATDHRIAPGFWWPMSAEAEDVIHVLETGGWPSVDAGDRWHGRGERGVLTREY